MASAHWNTKPSVGTWLLPPQAGALPWKLSVPAAPEETAVTEIAVPQTTSKPWQFTPSVGTWMMPLPLKIAAPASATTLSKEDQVELDIRQSAFDLFWQQFDEQEAEERFAPELPELSIRQAAFDLFWQQFDEQEAEERFAPEVPELSIRQAAFDLFWQQLDEQEAEERFAPELPELSIRQAAFDLFWQQLDEQEAEERFAPELPELSTRQASFELWCQQVDEKSTKSSSSRTPPSIVQKEPAPAVDALSKVQLMVGSPSACLRKRVKESMAAPWAVEPVLKAPTLSRSSSVGALRALKASKSTSSLKAGLTSKAMDLAIDCTLRHAGMDLTTSAGLRLPSRRVF